MYQKNLFLPLTVTVIGCLGRIYYFLEELQKESMNPRRMILAMITESYKQVQACHEASIPLEILDDIAKDDEEDEEPSIVIVETQAKRPNTLTTPRMARKKARQKISAAPNGEDEIDDIFGSL